MAIVVSSDRQAIGAFIREQRKATPANGHRGLVRRRRHVPHLTQADLAELAGVSEALVAQVETGRYANLTPGLLTRLAQALNLSTPQETYLLNYLTPVPAAARPPQSEVTAGIRSVVDTAEPNPALLINARFDILYWNRSATGLLGDFSLVPEEQRNVLWSMFGVPEMRQLWVDWETNARNMVSGLKMIVSRHPDYRPAINALVESLRQASPAFRRFWAEEAPALQPLMTKEYLHPRLGPMRLYQTVTEIAGSPDLSYILFTPADEPTARRFRQL